MSPASKPPKDAAQIIYSIKYIQCKPNKSRNYIQYKLYKVLNIYSINHIQHKLEKEFPNSEARLLVCLSDLEKNWPIIL